MHEVPSGNCREREGKRAKAFLNGTSTCRGQVRRGELAKKTAKKHRWCRRQSGKMPKSKEQGTNQLAVYCARESLREIRTEKWLMELAIWTSWGVWTRVFSVASKKWKPECHLLRKPFLSPWNRVAPFSLNLSFL